MDESEIIAEKFSTQCKARHRPIRFFRFNPQLKEIISLGETNDEKVIEMLIETKCYMAREDQVAKVGEIITVFKQLAQYHSDLQ